jgi:hypothetical protein
MSSRCEALPCSTGSMMTRAHRRPMMPATIPVRGGAALTENGLYELMATGNAGAWGHVDAADAKGDEVEVLAGVDDDLVVAPQAATQVEGVGLAGKARPDHDDPGHGNRMLARFDGDGHVDPPQCAGGAAGEQVPRGAAVSARWSDTSSDTCPENGHSVAARTPCRATWEGGWWISAWPCPRSRAAMWTGAADCQPASTF